MYPTNIYIMILIALFKTLIIQEINYTTLFSKKYQILEEISIKTNILLCTKSNNRKITDYCNTIRNKRTYNPELRVRLLRKIFPSFTIYKLVVKDEKKLANKMGLFQAEMHKPLCQKQL